MRSRPDDGSTAGGRGTVSAALAGKRALVLGRHPRLSAWLSVLAIASTIVVAAVVAATTIRYTPTGAAAEERIALHAPAYQQLWEWVTATLSGEHVHPGIVGGTVALLFAAAGSSYLNSGLVPTAGLVMGPIFGLFVNRVGTPMLVVDPNEPGFTYAPMPLPDAILWGVESALFLGIPITIVGFAAGALLRRAVPPAWVRARISTAR